jgi:hypothetical protein
MEANPEEIKSKVVYEEVPKEHAAVKPVRALNKWYLGQNLAAERHQKLKERTRGNCGSRKKLAATHRRMTCCAGVARRKGHGHQGHGRNNAARVAPKGQMRGDCGRVRNAKVELRTETQDSSYSSVAESSGRPSDWRL